MIEAKLETKDLKRVLRNAKGALSDQSKPMAEIARRLEQHVRESFRSEVDPWGIAWPELSDVTIEGRIREGNFSVQKLVDSEALFNSIASFGDHDTATVQAGEGLDGSYASVHQFGNPTNRAWGGVLAPIPARPFFPMRSEEEVAFPSEWLRSVFLPIEQHLDEALK